MKRIKKTLFILMLLILCSGCTIKYNLEINEFEIVENITVSDTAMLGRTNNDILETYDTWMPVYDNIDNPDLIQDSDDDGGKIEGIEYHEKNITKIENGYKHTYKYTYPIDKFNHANSLKLAFGKPSFYNGGSYINLRTDSDNVLCNYDYFESLQVNIKIDTNTYKVEKNNANRVKGNTYTWSFNRDNCHDSVISMTLSKINNTVITTTTSKSSNNGNSGKTTNGLNNYVLYIFLVVMVLIIFVGYRWFNKMKERDNGVDD